MESEHLREIKEVEIGQLCLRYTHTRIERPKESLALAGSIERVGQIIPVIVVREGVAFFLFDGYLRAGYGDSRDMGMQGGGLGFDSRPVP